MMPAKSMWRHVRRSPYQAFAAVFIIFQTFFVVSVFTLVILGSAKIISYFESLPQVNVFFKNEAKQEQIDALKQQLKATGKIANIQFVTKHEALKIYQEQNKGDPLLLDLVTADILPSSFKLSATNINDLPALADALKDSVIIREIVFPKDVVAKLTGWTSALRKIGIGLTSVLAIDSVLIMVIIIGIKISQKKEEIEIMRLLGATSWYIRWPFIYEGILYGVIGACVGWLLSVLGLLYATPFLSTFINPIPLLPVSPIFLAQLLGMELLLAIFLGAFASFLAVLRYLK